MNELFKSEINPLISIEIFQKHVLKYLVKLLDDKIEKHREYVLIILEKSIILENKSFQYY